MMTIVLLVLISVLGCGNAERTSGIVGCLNYQYMYNEACYSCPTQCKICVSETNCTVCNKGFYGPVCENNCDTNCTGACHKQYGHCTYGCPDGTYPADDNSCKSCSDPCTICTSESHCVLCKDGPCQETCPENCVRCNISSGQCLLCNGSFSLQDGQCRPHDSTERTRIATVLIVVTITVIVILIVIAVLVVFFRKRRCVMKKEKSNMTELSALENEPVECTIPLSTKDEDVKAECIAGKDEIFPKSTSEHDDDDISDIDKDAVVLLPSEDVTPCQNLENMSEEAPGTVQEPEPETSELHKPQDDGSSYMDTGTMPSKFGAQLKFKPYDTQQLSPTESVSGIATLPNNYYQDSPQLAIKPTSTKSKGHVPYARPKSRTHVVLKEDLTSEGANQIYNKQIEQYT